MSADANEARILALENENRKLRARLALLESHIRATRTTSTRSQPPGGLLEAVTQQADVARRTLPVPHPSGFQCGPHGPSGRLWPGSSADVARILPPRGSRG